ncbi:hypothetical protein FQN49_003983 [Arthroderma sp. PD_2]|nr:hypothetical protein FQN49_003983 [Arthroderma sp. PD_2]
MDTSVRTHAFMLAVTILPPLGPLYLWENARADSNPPYLCHVLIFLIWAGAAKSIVYNHYLGPLSGIPMAPGDWFILGHTPYIFSAIPGGWVLKFINNAKFNTCGMMRMKSMFHLSDTILLTDPGAFNEVLSRHCYDYIKPPKRSMFVERITGRGLAIAERAEHKFQRKSLRPAFQGHVIKELVPKMWLKSLEFAEFMASKSKAAGGAIEFNSFVSSVTLDIIGVAAFDEDFKSLNSSANELAATFRKVLEPTWELISYFAACMLLPSWISIRLPMAGNKTLAASKAKLLSLCRQLLVDKKAVFQADGKSSITVLSTLLKNGDLSDDRIREQMLTFLVAGHETTSTATTFAVYLLATHPEVQDKLRDELIGVLSQYRPDEITVQVLDSIPLLAAIASETLRLWPVVPLPLRVAIKDTTIQGVTIPKGTRVDMSTLAANRLESIWGADAADFKPERWLDEGNSTFGGTNNPLVNNIPFLFGPRGCIGQNFARAEVRCLLAAFVERFKFEMLHPDKELVIAGAIGIKPLGGLHLRITDIGTSLK